MNNEMADFLKELVKDKEVYLRRGLELAKYPTQSKEVNEVFAAFSQAQKEFIAVTKDCKAYNYKYAELASILNQVRPILAKFDLCFTQYTTRNNVLHTRIGHSSGQWFESQFQIPVISEKEYYENNKNKAYMQEVGSRKTYARRYEALALLGIHPEGEDDDGKGGR